MASSSLSLMPELRSSVINIHQMMTKEGKEHSTTSLYIPMLVGDTWQGGSIAMKNTEQSRPLKMYYPNQKVISVTVLSVWVQCVVTVYIVHCERFYCHMRLSVGLELL